MPDRLYYAMTNILNTILNTRELSIFSTAIKITSLDQILDSRCDYTVFAPNNIAFAQLSKVNLDILTKDTVLLTEILNMHIVFGEFGYQDLLKMCAKDEQDIMLTSIDSSQIYINLSDGIRVGNSTVLSTDASSSNGIIHLIDQVMIPKQQHSLA